MKGYDYIFEHYKTTEADFVPNTLEDFHDTKKVRPSLFRAGVFMMTNR